MLTKERELEFVVDELLERDSREACICEENIGWRFVPIKFVLADAVG